MAFEGTHIRFALDLKDMYGVKDLKRYVSGAMYPDSRYITKIDRAATHPEDYRDWDITRIDDFRKGWFSHLFADDLQWAITKKLLPEAFEGTQGPASERWIKHTALKILQDMDDLQKFGVKFYLPFLSHVENPNGEDLKILREYNGIFLKIYAQPEVMTVDHYYEVFLEFGVGDELATKVKLQAEAYGRDKRVMEILMKIYPEMVKRAMS